MPTRSRRSRTFRKIKVRTPGGRTVMHYGEKKNAFAKCAVCKKPLSGVPIGRDSDIAKLSKSERRPERPFGGHLCPSCSRREIKKRLFESVQ
jgi:large subunit ribosomal protein L34e